MTAAIRYFSFRCLAKLKKPTDSRPIFAYINRNYGTRESGDTNHCNRNKVVGGYDFNANNRFVSGNYASAFGTRLLRPGTCNGVLFGGIGMNCRSYSSSVSSSQNGNVQDAIPVPSNSPFDGKDWTDKIKELWNSTVDVVSYAGEKGKEASGEVTVYGQQLLDTHPCLRDVVVPVGGTLMGTLLAWMVLPKLLRRFHKYSMQGPAILLSDSSLWGPVPYEKSFWGALEDPVRYLVTFMAFSQIGVMVAPTTIAAQYIAPAWRGAVIISFIWFLNRWKANVVTRALAIKSMDAVNRNKLLTVDKISSVGLFVIGLMALAEALGVAVQSVLTVGGIGGVATAFASRDILGNILSGLSVQISQPFSIGDTIKAGSVEGQAVEMGLTTTTLLTAEKFPVLVPNSLFSSQVIVNKSRAQWRAMVTKIPLQVDGFDQIPKISEDIKTMLKSNTNVFLEKEAPYCFLSRIERSFAELTIGCNLKSTNKEKFFSAQQDILLQSVEIIKQHGDILGNYSEDANNL